MIDLKKLKPGDAIHNTNTAYPSTFGFYLGEEMGGRLLYIQWLKSRVEKVFREDAEKAFTRIKLLGIRNEEVLWTPKRK